MCGAIHVQATCSFILKSAVHCDTVVLLSKSKNMVPTSGVGEKLDLGGRTPSQLARQKKLRKGHTVMLPHWPIFSLTESIRVACYPGLLVSWDKVSHPCWWWCLLFLVPVPSVSPLNSLSPAQVEVEQSLAVLASDVSAISDNTELHFDHRLSA